MELVEMSDFHKCLKSLVPGAGVEPEPEEKRTEKTRI